MERHILYTWYFEKITASVTSSGHSALGHEASRICTILILVICCPVQVEVCPNFHKNIPSIILYGYLPVKADDT